MSGRVLLRNSGAFSLLSLVKQLDGVSSSLHAGDGSRHELFWVMPAGTTARRLVCSPSWTIELLALLYPWTKALHVSHLAPYPA